MQRSEKMESKYFQLLLHKQVKLDVKKVPDKVMGCEKMYRICIGDYRMLTKS